MYLGIGPVLNLRFNLAFSQVLWDPLLNVGVVSNLYYQVTVKNNEFLVDDTTNNTYYPITSMVKRCHEYTANVTAFSAEYHHSISVVHKEEPLLGVCVCVCTSVWRVCTHMHATFAIRRKSSGPTRLYYCRDRSVPPVFDVSTGE